MTKTDYLRDLADHPASTGLEAAARLDVPESNVLEAYRRARKQGLIRGDDGRPQKFFLTDPGIECLRVLASEMGHSNANPASTLTADVRQRLSEIEGTLGDLSEDVRVLFRFADKHLGESRNSAAAPMPDTSIEEDMVEEIEALRASNKKLEEDLKQRSKVLEFYAVELALVDLGSRRLHRYREALEPQLDPGLVQRVRRLLEVEEALYREQRGFFGGDEETILELQRELSDLRKELGFVFEHPSLAASDKDTQEAGEN